MRVAAWFKKPPDHPAEAANRVTAERFSPGVQRWKRASLRRSDLHDSGFEVVGACAITWVPAHDAPPARLDDERLFDQAEPDLGRVFLHSRPYHDVAAERVGVAEARGEGGTGWGDR